MLAAGRARGLGPRIHASQLGPGTRRRVAAEAGAASADHCTYLTDADVDTIVSAPLVATLLPGAEFGTRHPYPDARRLLDAGATVALATDCNPGSSFTSSMAFCIALAVRDMRMTTQEAVWAATAGGATGAAPGRRRPSRRGRAGRPDPAGRPVARLPGLPPRRPARRRGLAGWPPGRGNASRPTMRAGRAAQSAYGLTGHAAPQDPWAWPPRDRSPAASRRPGPGRARPGRARRTGAVTPAWSRSVAFSATDLLSRRTISLCCSASMSLAACESAT